MKAALLGTACLMALVMPASAQAPETAKATFMTADGKEVGSATLSETPDGVLIDLDVTGVPAGEHGFHIHETGTCDAAGGFESAGPHYAGGDHDHGFMAEGGPHAGDMPNQFVQEDGVLRAHVVNAKVTLGEGDASLFKEGGTAIIIHAGTDDYESQPAGDAGERWACAVVEEG